MKAKDKLKLLIAAAVGVMALLALPAVASAKDRNHDHIPDRWEKRHHLSLHKNQARKDQDHDGLRNRAEFMAEDNPRNPDTNGNGIKDGEENAGEIESFDEASGKLTIDLFGGETITGYVTEETEIECHHSGATASSDGGEESSQDEEEAGDEEGDHSGEEADSEDSHSGEEADGEDSHSGEEAEDDQGDNGEEGGNGGNCTSANLTEGAIVREAELHLENGKAIFDTIELAG